MADTLKIPMRGEDGYKVSSIRLRRETWDALNEIAAKSKRSCNEVISIMLEYGIDHTEVVEGEAADGRK